MMPVDCYKGLSNRLLVYGFQAVDLIIILLLFMVVHRVKQSILIDLIFLILAYYIAKKGRDRPDGYFISLMMFVYVVPPMAPLDRYRDISPYRKSMIVSKEDH